MRVSSAIYLTIIDGEAMNSISPVFNEDSQPSERVIALDQPEYAPIVILPLTNKGGAMMVRFELTEVERNLIAEGANLVITELTFGPRFTPICVQVVPPGVDPDTAHLS